MSGSLAEFLGELGLAKKALNKNKSPQLSSQTQRASLRSLVEKYFNQIRPAVIGGAAVNQDVENIDGDMQQLLILCHKRGSVEVYKKLLTKIRKDLILLDARVVTSPKINIKSNNENELDAIIIATLEKIVPSAALSYRQALFDLQMDTRLSWRGPATDLREALRETLDYLAPDDDVINMQGYRQLPDTNGPTMKQKVSYLLKKRGLSKALSTPAATATESIEEAVGSFVRSVYTRSSVSTHTPTEKGEVARIRDFVRVVLCELLEIHA